jgi:hypothetical protein
LTWLSVYWGIKGACKGHSETLLYFELRIMIEKSTYRLAEYQITEYDDGALQWTVHHGFGEQWSGKCFILDDILVLEEFTHEEIGYLKGEFLDHIRKLPVWNKTKFYCFASDLLDVSSGRSLSRDWKNYLPSTRGAARNRSQAPKVKGPLTFPLDKYKVTVADNDQISWQALEGGDRVAGGQCIIQSGILFIGPREYETGQRSRQEFLEELNDIPPWKRTKIWSHSLALRPCEPPPQTGHINAMAQRDTWRDHRYLGSTVSTFWKANQKTLKSLWPPDMKFKIPSSPVRRLSSLKLRKPSQSPRGLRKVGFILLIPLLLAGVLLGLILGLHSVEETSHHHHASEKPHHR